MAWEPRPVPNVTPETAPFWEAAADDRLLLRRCQDCDLTYYYARSHCPDCFSDDVAWVEAAGTGTVYACTHTSAVSRWPEDALPVTVAYVELDEGPRVLTVIEDGESSADVSIGTRVTVEFVPTEDDDIGIPVFTPADGASDA